MTASLAACRVGPNYHAPALPSGAEAPLVSLNSAARDAGGAAGCVVAPVQ